MRFTSLKVAFLADVAASPDLASDDTEDHEVKQIVAPDPPLPADSFNALG